MIKIQNRKTLELQPHVLVIYILVIGICFGFRISDLPDIVMVINGRDLATLFHILKIE